MHYIKLSATALILIVIALFISSLIGSPVRDEQVVEDLDPKPQNLTLTGTYECLPRIDGEVGADDECIFGLRTDEGEHYAVIFGQSASSIEGFKNRARITAEGFLVIKEALSSSEWMNYDMVGIFTITNMIKQSSPAEGKLNIEAICGEALMYMTFPDGAAADAFVAACKEGKHPEVIDDYNERNGLTNDVVI